MLKLIRFCVLKRRARRVEKALLRKYLSSKLSFAYKYPHTKQYVVLLITVSCTDNTFYLSFNYDGFTFGKYQSFDGCGEVHHPYGFKVSKAVEIFAYLTEGLV